MLGRRTSSADAYLMDIIFDLCVCWFRSHADRVEREVFRCRQQCFDGNAAEVAATLLIGQKHGVLPAVEVEHFFERIGDTGPGAADPHRRVVCRGVIQLDVATPLRVERYVPVGCYEPNRVARCTEQYTTDIINDI